MSNIRYVSLSDRVEEESKLALSRELVNYLCCVALKGHSSLEWPVGGDIPKELNR